MGGVCEFPQLYATWRTAVCAFWWKTLARHALERRPGRAGVPAHSFPGSHAAAFRPLRAGPSQGSSSQPPLHCICSAWTWDVQRAISHRTLQSGCVDGAVHGSKGPIGMHALPTFRPHTPKLLILVPVSSVWVLPPLRLVLNPAGVASVLRLRGQPHY